MNDKERLRRKIKLTKQTILQELESSEGKHPESISISTSFLLDIIREYEQQQKKIERYENALREIDTHIRSTPEPVPYIIQTLKATLPEYK